MPLVKCKECGKEISSAAPNCPYCGVPEPGNYPVCRIQIHRKWVLMFNSFGGMSIYINDKYISHIGNGESINIDTLPGQLTISARAFMCPSAEIILSAYDKESYSFEVAFSPYPSIERKR